MRHIKFRYRAIRDQSNKCNFSAFQKVHGDMVKVRSAAGRLFQVEGSQTEMLRFPMFVFVRWTSNWPEEADGDD